MAERIRGLAGCSLLQAEERDAILAAIPRRGRVLEIGTLSGASVAYFAARRPQATFLSVDIFVKGPSPGAGSPANWLANRQPNMRLFVGTAGELLEFSRAGVFDLVFIDGDHSKTGCRRDLRASLGLLAPGGLLAAHDYCGERPGVIRAVDQFSAEAGFAIVKRVQSTVFLSKGT